MPPPEEQRAAAHAALEKALASSAFARAPRDQSFLRFVCDEALAGRGGDLKETVIATTLFGRKGGYDPKVDSIVRVVASHVRRRLEQYYQTEGAADALRIVLPRGGYEPTFAPPAEKPVGALRRRRWLIAAVALSALAGVGIGYLLRSPAWRSDRTALVVLPFANLDGSPESDRLADALSEDLTTELARGARLRVVARTSALLFRKQGADAREIGARLAVGSMLEGSVRRSGGVVRITAQLIELRGGYHLWSEAFEGPPARLAEFQDRIAQAVRRRLGDSGPPPRSVPLPSPEAQDAYFQARYLLRRGAEGREKAVPLLEKAVALEPRYPAAWAALATAYSTMAFHMEGPTAELAAKAKAAGSRALELDPESAEAAVAMGGVAYAREHDWAAADAWFRRALAASPNYPRALTANGLFLMTRARAADAVHYLRQARDLDPLSSIASNDFAVVLWCAGRYRESIQAAGRSLAVQPDFAAARIVRGMCYVETGDLAGAGVDLEEALRLVGRLNVVLGALGYRHARAGRRAEAETLAREIQANGGSFHAAVIAAGMGDRTRAIELLNQSLAGGETDAVFFPSHPAFAGLGAEPGYRALLARVGL
jgi:TolB-like protein/Tfp pilus assembly protein PilF